MYNDEIFYDAINILFITNNFFTISLFLYETIINAYQQMRDFNYENLRLIEPLRTMRLIHFSAWIARRWQDPAFQRAFSYFGTPRYWQDQLLDLREQLGVIQNSQGFGDY